MNQESRPLSLRNTETEAQMDEQIGERNEITAPHDTSRPRIHNGVEKGGKKLAFLSDIPTEEKPEFKWSVVTPELEGLQGSIANESANEVGLITGTPAADFGSVISCGFDSTFPENTRFTVSFEITPSIVVMLQFVEGDFSDFSLSGDGPSNFFMMVQGGNIILTSSHPDIAPLNITAAVTTGIQEFAFERVADEWFLSLNAVNEKIHIGSGLDPIAAMIVGSLDGSPQTVRTNASSAVPATSNALIVSLSDSDKVRPSNIIKPISSIKTNSQFLTSVKDDQGNVKLNYTPISSAINTTTPSTVNYLIVEDSLSPGKDPLIKMSTSFPNLDTGTVRTITIPSENDLSSIKNIGAIYGMSNRGSKDGVKFQGGTGVQIIQQDDVKGRGLLVALKIEPNKWFIHKIQKVKDINEALSEQVSHNSNLHVLYSGIEVAKISDQYHLTLNEYFQIQQGETFGMPSKYSVNENSVGFQIVDFYKGLGSLKRKIVNVTPSLTGANSNKRFFLSTSRNGDHLSIKCVDDTGVGVNGVFDIHSRIVENSL